MPEHRVPHIVTSGWGSVSLDSHSSHKLLEPCSKQMRLSPGVAAELSNIHTCRM